MPRTATTTYNRPASRSIVTAQPMRLPAGWRRAITTALTAFRGPVGTTDFRGIFKDGDRDFREGSTQGVDAYFRATLDFLVHYKEQ